MDPQSQELHNSLSDYYRLGTIAHNTITILARFVSRLNSLSEEQEATLTAALEHLADVREGFQFQLRASDVQTLAEMQYLVDRALVDWRWLEQMQWQVQPLPELELPRTQRLAFAHAYLSLATLPRLPRHQITFPSATRSYADIPVPSSGAELLLRLEELEQVIYRVLGGARTRVREASLRRTYGFFESSAWLVSHHRQKFLTA